MNIIFGPPSADMLEKYTVLELDTFKFPNDRVATSYCVVEKLPLEEFMIAESLKKVHADLLHYYRQREWNYCLQAIEGLTGKWNGDLDSFYTNLADRIKQYQESPPPESWDGFLVRGDTSSQTVTG